MYMKNRDARVELHNECSFATDEALSRPSLTQVCVHTPYVDVISEGFVSIS
jgi:hypothetical protein